MGASCIPPTRRWRCSLGYLLGSIPFGLLLTQAAGLGDVRKIGSGNIGATNVLRTGHKGLAAATLLLDALKGTVAVLHRRTSSARATAASRPSALLHRRPRRLPRPPLPRLAPLHTAARASPPTSACCSALHWPPALALLPGLARGGAARRAIPRWRRWLPPLVCRRALLLATGQAGSAVHPAHRASDLHKHHANIRRLLAGEERKIGARA